jgi:hypothetical protein
MRSTLDAAATDPHNPATTGSVNRRLDPDAREGVSRRGFRPAGAVVRAAGLGALEPAARRSPPRCRSPSDEVVSCLGGAGIALVLVQGAFEPDSIRVCQESLVRECSRGMAGLVFFGCVMSFTLSYGVSLLSFRRCVGDRMTR